MRVRLLTVGKPKDARLIALHDDYARRIERLGVRYATAAVPEVRAGSRFSDDHVRQREARALLQAADGPGTLVALYPAGRTLSSEQLAERLEGWLRPGLTLAIGGPLGLHRELTTAAAFGWSLSPLTFPHELVRVVVAEQIYRALTILRGIPYHK